MAHTEDDNDDFEAEPTYDQMNTMKTGEMILPKDSFNRHLIEYSDINMKSLIDEESLNETETYYMGVFKDKVHPSMGQNELAQEVQSARAMTST